MSGPRLWESLPYLGALQGLDEVTCVMYIPAWPPALAGSLVKVISSRPIPDLWVWAEILKPQTSRGGAFWFCSLPPCLVLFLPPAFFLSSNYSHFLSTVAEVAPGAVPCFTVVLDQADDDN